MQITLSHIVLNFGLCNPMLKSPPGTSMAIHVRLTDKMNRSHFERTFDVIRNDAPVTVSFDVDPGEYAFETNAPAYDCNALDYAQVLPGHGRTIRVQLFDGPAPQTEPLLFAGTVPQSALYLAPEYVLFAKSQACNERVGDPIPIRFAADYDHDAFYIKLYPDASLNWRRSEIVALELRTPAGGKQYLRLKTPLPTLWEGWPQAYVAEVDKLAVNWLATQPTNTLLCPKPFVTTAE